MKIKFHSKPFYEYKYLKAKLKEYDGVIKTNFLGNGIKKENMHYTCIGSITIDSVMKVDEEYFPQVYLEECKYKIKKTQMSRYIDAKLNSDSDDDSDSDFDDFDDFDDLDDSDDSDDDSHK